MVTFFTKRLTVPVVAVCLAALGGTIAATSASAQVGPNNPQSQQRPVRPPPQAAPPQVVAPQPRMVAPMPNVVGPGNPNSVYRPGPRPQPPVAVQPPVYRPPVYRPQPPVYRPRPPVYRPAPAYGYGAPIYREPTYQYYQDDYYDEPAYAAPRYVTPQRYYRAPAYAGRQCRVTTRYLRSGRPIRVQECRVCRPVLKRNPYGQRYRTTVCSWVRR